MRRNISFAVIGVQKCATTWIYDCLKNNPQLSLPNKKRERFYFGGPEHQSRGDEWYFSKFGNVSQDDILVDVSVDYFYYPQALENLKKHSKNLKVIVSLRDPIDRFVSAYFWAGRKSKLNLSDINDFTRGLLAEWPSLKNKEKSDIKHSLLLRGFYGTQLKEVLRSFDLSEVLLINYHNVKGNPIREIDRINDFMGVDNFVDKYSINRVPKKNTYNRRMAFLESTAGRIRPIAKGLDWFNSRINTDTDFMKNVSLAGDVRKRLSDVFAPEMNEFQEILGEFDNNCSWTKDFRISDFTINYE